MTANWRGPTVLLMHVCLLTSIQLAHAGVVLSECKCMVCIAAER